MRGRYILGLDIGTTKICAVVASVMPHGVEIIGSGISGSSGLRKGVVVDIDLTAQSIREAIERAAGGTGIELGEAFIGVAGGHIKSARSYGATGIKGAEVTDDDIERVMDSAAAVYVPLDREVLHVLPGDFVIDGQDGIVRPLGMSGVRLEANVSVITASQAAVENLVKCCSRAGIEVLDTVFEPIASTYAVSSEEEMRLGVAVIDMGGGTTDLAVYRDGNLRHSSVLAVGGNHITNDIAIGMRLSQSEAERLKKTYGRAVASTAPEERDATMQVMAMNGARREMPVECLLDIIRPRCEEMFHIIGREIQEATLYNSPSCVVLTGGTALLEGMDRLAEATLGLPVRLGVPTSGLVELLDEGLETPECSTGVGLVVYGLRAGSKSYESVLGGLMQRVRGRTRNLLEVRGWGLFRKESRPALRS